MPATERAEQGGRPCLVGPGKEIAEAREARKPLDPARRAAAVEVPVAGHGTLRT
jgi:hypothetical protein